MILMVDKKILTATQVQELMGVSKAGVFMQPEHSEQALAVLTKQFPLKALPYVENEKARKAGYAVMKQTEERESAKKNQDRLNNKFDFGGAK
jgi:hypothetical protein